MNRRCTFTLDDATTSTLQRLAGRGNQSSFVRYAVRLLGNMHSKGEQGYSEVILRNPANGDEMALSNWSNAQEAETGAGTQLSLTWHQYHTYLCILESDSKLSFSSNLEDTREHPAYAGLIIMGNAIIPYLKADIIHDEPGWARMMLLWDLVPPNEQPPFPEEVAGKLRDLWGIWQTWAMEGWQ